MDTKVQERSDPGGPFLFGWCSVTPQRLQGLARAGWFLVFISIANVFQSMTVNGLVGVILSSLETRFGFTSAQSSWIVSAYDVSTVPVLIIISYWGARSHRPRWTALGLFLLLLGSILFILPHFTTDVYNPGGGEGDDWLCRNRTLDDPCDQDSQGPSLSGYLAVFIVGRLLHGIGAVPLYTISVTYMDDCVTKETFSLYVAIFYAAGVLGPALGYIVGGYLLTIFTDFHSLDDPGFTDSDPRWVGAWWLAFLIAAVCLLLIIIPLFGYPRDLPGAAEVRAKKVSEAYSRSNKDDDEDSGGMGNMDLSMGIKELGQQLKGILLNPTYVCMSLFVAADGILMSGFTAFGPKYVENQFGISAAFAGILFGIVVIPGGAGGTVAGGYFIKKLKLKCAGIMKWELIFTVLILLGAAIFFIQCDPVRFAGVTIDYNLTMEGDVDVNLGASCNLPCMCEDVTFDPICSLEDVIYYSPCHAGCVGLLENTEDSTREFFNCSCITAAVDGELAASSGTCTNDSCNLIPLFMVIFFFAMFLLFACSAMSISATIRCVTGPQRSLAIGLQWIVLRLLGTVPGPLVFAEAFDNSCILWQENCGMKGSCLLNDNVNMSLYMCAVCLGVKAASLVVVLLAWKLYKPPTTVEKVEIEVTSSDTNNITHPSDPATGNKDIAMVSNGQVGIVSAAFVDDENILSTAL